MEKLLLTLSLSMVLPCVGMQHPILLDRTQKRSEDRDRTADVNARDAFGRTALHVAALYGDTELVLRLLKQGANVDIKDMYERTPLHYAVQKGETELIRVLLERGANVNAKNIWGDTPLLVAAYYGHVKVIKLLVASGANVNEENNDGKNVLHEAARGRSDGVVELLIALCPGVLARDNCGRRIADAKYVKAPKRAMEDAGIGDLSTDRRSAKIKKLKQIIENMENHLRYLRNLKRKAQHFAEKEIRWSIQNCRKFCAIKEDMRLHIKEIEQMLECIKKMDLLLDELESKPLAEIEQYFTEIKLWFKENEAHIKEKIQSQYTKNTIAEKLAQSRRVITWEELYS